MTRLSQQQVSLDVVDVEKLVEQIIFERPDFQPPSAEVTVARPLLPMRAHEASLTQCITNLVNNAVKFVAPGVKPQVRIYSEVAAEKVRLWIKDNGIGIESAAQSKLFQIFNRLHNEEQYEGTGVGLAIVRKAVERMGGVVGFESEPGKGSRFWVELQAVDGQMDRRK
jgi:signal transduction histidine kinase